MAVLLNVFLERSKLPTFSSWSEAILREGFPLNFPEAVDLTKHTGYLPALFRNEETGFEFYVSNLEDSDVAPNEVQLALPAADTVAWFRFTEMDECLAATAAAFDLSTSGRRDIRAEDGRAIQGKSTGRSQKGVHSTPRPGRNNKGPLSILKSCRLPSGHRHLRRLYGEFILVTTSTRIFEGGMWNVCERT